MKLQQKLESSLDDIIKKDRKKPNISNKSKGITRTGNDKLNRLKQLNRKKSKPGKARTEETPNRFRGNKKSRFNQRSQGTTRGDSDDKPRVKKGGKKWVAPRRAQRFHRGSRGGRNRN